MGQDIRAIASLFKTMPATSSTSSQSNDDMNFKDVLFNNDSFASGRRHNSDVDKSARASYTNDRKVIVTSRKLNQSVNDVNNNNQKANIDKINESDNSVNNEIAKVSVDTGEITEVSTTQTKTEEAIMQEVMKTLELTKEQLESIMTLLGLTPMDLLDKDNLKQLILEVNETDDMLKFATDVNMADTLKQLYQSVQNIYTENLQSSNNEQFNLQEANINEVIESTLANEDYETIEGTHTTESNEEPQSIDLLINKEDIQNATSTANDKIKANEDISIKSQGDIKDNTQTVEKTLDVNIQNTAEEDISQNDIQLSTDQIKLNDSVKSEKENVTTDDLKNANVNTSEAKPVVKIEAETDSKSFNDKKSSEEQPKTESGSKLENTVETFVRNIAEQADEHTDFTVREFREIVNQIVEQIKVSIKPGVSSMDIQLNPESLGKINLQVVSKDGTLTAQFVAQNQIAKEAIESQMMVLKENLNNQGLKVEAIEVTVANFGFDQNKGTGEENKETKQPRRKLSLDDINALLTEDLSEDEKLAVDVMIQNGSTVDYTA